MRLRTLQPDNPILRAEMAYQRRTIPRSLQWFDRFGVILVALVTSVCLLYFPVINNTYGISWPVENVKALLVLLWITQIVMMLRCVIAGFNATRNHHGRQHWEALTLTGISPRRLFIGKWWGVLHGLRGWLVALGIFKLALFAYVTVSLIAYCYLSPFLIIVNNLSIYSRDSVSFAQVAINRSNETFQSLPPLNRIVLTGFLIVCVSLLEILASTVIGMVGGLFSVKSIGLVAALALRFSTFAFMWIPDYRLFGSVFLWRWNEYTLFSLVDGGSTAILRAGLVYRGSFNSSNQITESVLRAFYAAIIMYLAYLLFAFVVSHILLRWQGLLPASSK